MNKFVALLHAWPVPAAALMSGAMFVAVAVDQVTLPGWLTEAFVSGPEDPKAPSPGPDTRHDVPYGPAPGRDDRTPPLYLSQVFGLNDTALPEKLTGIGPVFWDHGGQGTGALIATNIVLTTGHLFAERGKWDGPNGRSKRPPAAADGRIYLAVCKRAYELKTIHLGSMAPRARLGLDYAIVELATPACDEATVLPVADTPNDLAAATDQVLLNMGAYRFADLERYAQHPLFAQQAVRPAKHARYAVFGVRCAARGHHDTGRVANGSTGVIVTEGCDGVPGGSGGPLLVSRDAGVTYSIVGVANSYRPNTEYNNYTRIEGAFAKHLAQFVDLIELPAADSANSPNASMSTKLGPWLPMTWDIQTEELSK